MQSILIPITKETDISFILSFLKKLGMKATIIDEETRQMKARESLVVLSRKTKKTDISGKEIMDEIKAYRKSKHAVK